jgi:glycosyltransferase involved in cell wall biosynthesis
VPPADPDALAGRIIELLGDPALRNRLGQAARQRAAEFDVRSSVRRTEDAYGELTG